MDLKVWIVNGIDLLIGITVSFLHHIDANLIRLILLKIFTCDAPVKG